MSDHIPEADKMVQVPRETLERWTDCCCANVAQEIEDIIDESDDLSTNAPDMDTSPEHVDDVDMSRIVSTMIEDRLSTFLAVDVVEAIGAAIVGHERNEHGKAPTYPEDSVNDPDCIEAAPENVITTSHPMPTYVVSMTDNGDGSYHVVWDNKTEADMVSVSATPHSWARGMLDLRGSVDPREAMADLHGTTEYTDALEERLCAIEKRIEAVNSTMENAVEVTFARMDAHGNRLEDRLMERIRLVRDELLKKGGKDYGDHLDKYHKATGGPVIINWTQDDGDAE